MKLAASASLCPLDVHLRPAGRQPAERGLPLHVANRASANAERVGVGALGTDGDERLFVLVHDDRREPGRHRRRSFWTHHAIGAALPRERAALKPHVGDDPDVIADAPCWREDGPHVLR